MTRGCRGCCCCSMRPRARGRPAAPSPREAAASPPRSLRARLGSRIRLSPLPPSPSRSPATSSGRSPSGLRAPTPPEPLRLPPWVPISAALRLRRNFGVSPSHLTAWRFPESCPSLFERSWGFPGCAAVQKDTTAFFLSVYLRTMLRQSPNTLHPNPWEFWGEGTTAVLRSRTATSAAPHLAYGQMLLAPILPLRVTQGGDVGNLPRGGGQGCVWRKTPAESVLSNTGFRYLLGCFNLFVVNAALVIERVWVLWSEPPIQTVHLCCLKKSRAPLAQHQSCCLQGQRHKGQ